MLRYYRGDTAEENSFQLGYTTGSRPTEQSQKLTPPSEKQDSIIHFGRRKKKTSQGQVCIFSYKN